MRTRPAQLKSSSKPTALSMFLPAPIGGWNARDPIDRLKPTEAIKMINWWPKTNEVEFRRGSTVFGSASFPGGPVQTIMEHDAGSVRVMLAAGGGAVVKATTAGVMTSLGTGFGSDRWQHAMLSANTVMVNGTDTPQAFDGTTLAATTFTGTGLTATNLTGITVHGSRLYLWEAAQSYFWYGGVDAIAGALSKFDLNLIGRKGGNIVLAVNWTRDGGDGVDDFIAFAMTSGEYIIYTGTNPGDPTSSNFTLIGRFYGAPPISIRSAIQYQGDAIILTKMGAISLNAMLPFQGTRQALALTDKISGAWMTASDDYGDNYGWEAVVYPHGPWFLFNIPTLTPAAPTPVSSDQYIMNLYTGAWGQFQGWNARTWGVFNDQLYFGGNEQGVSWDLATWDVDPWYSGLVVQADVGQTDLTISNGDQAVGYITGTFKTAFIDPKSAPGWAQIKMVRPYFVSQDSLTANIAISVDYGDVTPLSTSTQATNTGQSVWDTATWDVDPWAGAEAVLRSWITTAAIGSVAALTVNVLTGYNTPKFRGWDMVYEPGGNL